MYIFLQILLTLNSMLIIKYMAIFCLRNPLAIRDDFWTAYINMCITAFSVVAQVSLDIGYSGDEVKNSLTYYVCTGQDPLKEVRQYEKPRLMQHIILAITVCLHCTLGLRISLYKKKIRQKRAVALLKILHEKPRINFQFLPWWLMTKKRDAVHRSTPHRSGSVPRCGYRRRC